MDRCLRLMSMRCTWRGIRTTRSRSSVVGVTETRRRQLSTSPPVIMPSRLGRLHGLYSKSISYISTTNFSTGIAVAESTVNLSAVTVTKTALDSDKRRLEVDWNDGTQSVYPYIWLRDNCQCSTCVDVNTRSRKLLFRDIDLNAMPVNVQTNSSNQEVIITWSDDHHSAYQYSWLIDRSFRYAEQLIRSRWNGRSAKLWKNNLNENVTKIRFDEYMRDDRQLYNWLTALEEDGFALLTNVPTETGQLSDIASRVAYLRETVLGETSLENTAQETTTDLSRTVGSQELHNDLVYCYNVPGMKMVHCIGGKDDQVTQFVDGFQVAEKLKSRHPDDFRLLSTTKLDFIFHTRIGPVMSRHQTIKLDENGEIIQLHYSTRSRDAFCNQPVDDVDKLYRALKKFAELLYDPESVVEMQLQAGVVYCFNNWRVLHGRKEFKLAPSSEPVIERGYIDWDELHSRRRLLKTKLAIPDEDY